MVVVPLRVFQLRVTTVTGILIPFRVLSQKKYADRNNFSDRLQNSRVFAMVIQMCCAGSLKWTP